MARQSESLERRNVASELRTEPVFDALKQPLALVESDERRRQIEAYLEAARVPLDRAVFDLMSQLVQAVDEKTADHYRIRLAYRPGGLGLEIEEKVQNGDEARWSTLEGDVEKITVRIPAELKDLATQAAAQAGTSANAWFVKALARSVRGNPAQAGGAPQGRWADSRDDRSKRGSRFTGWVGGDDE
jgi:hypothetical protein